MVSSWKCNHKLFISQNQPNLFYIFKYQSPRHVFTVLTISFPLLLPDAKVFEICHSEHPHMPHGAIRYLQLVQIHVQRQHVMVCFQSCYCNGKVFHHTCNLQPKTANKTVTIKQRNSVTVWLKHRCLYNTMSIKTKLSMPTLLFTRFWSLQFSMIKRIQGRTDIAILLVFA